MFTETLWPSFYFHVDHYINLSVVSKSVFILSIFVKGPWRWFDESMLDCCEPLEKVKARGISLGKLVCLANCAGAKVQAFRTNQSTIDDFRKYIHRCSTSDDCHIISSYHRAALKQVSVDIFNTFFSQSLTYSLVKVLFQFTIMIKEICWIITVGNKACNMSILNLTIYS